jgi:hypothetical protein
MKLQLKEYFFKDLAMMSTFTDPTYAEVRREFMKDLDEEDFNACWDVMTAWAFFRRGYECAMNKVEQSK